MDVCKTFSIEAARSLPHLPENHPCSKIHGHSFKITLMVSGPVDKDTGFVMDFGELETLFEPLRKQIDHSYLNDIEGLENPSSENLCKWIWKKLILSLPRLSQIEIRETDSTNCIYKGD